MAYGTHDLYLMSIFSQRISHGLAVHAEALVLLGIGFVPGPKGAIELCGINAHQAVADDGSSGSDKLSLGIAAAKTLEASLAEAIDPLLDRLVTAHAGKNSTRRQGEDGGQFMSTPRRSARVWDALEEVGQGAHLIGKNHHLGYSGFVGEIKGRT